MAPRIEDDDHRAVMSNLRDLQARLRGDPASMVLPERARRPDEGVTVADADVAVTAEPRPTEIPLDPSRRIEALRRKLEFLELEIDAYEQAADGASSAHEPRPAEADVVALQHAVEERLADE